MFAENLSDGSAYKDKGPHIKDMNLMPAMVDMTCSQYDSVLHKKAGSGDIFR